MKLVLPRAITLAGVDLTGGYFPLRYDQDRYRPPEGEPLPLSIPNDMSLGGFKVGKGVDEGMTKERIEGYAAPVKLDFRLLPQFIDEAIHYATHAEMVHRVEKMLRRQDVSDAVINKLGRNQYEGMIHWLEAVATDDSRPEEMSPGERHIRPLQKNLAVATLSSVSTALVQTLGVTTSIATLGSREGGKFSQKEGQRWLSKGLDVYLKNPQEVAKWVFAMSPLMSHRFLSQEANQREAVADISDINSVWGQIQRASLVPMTSIQLFAVDLPTWVGAYAKADSLGYNHEQSVEYADKIVRLAQGAGHVKDKAEVQRYKGWWRLATMYSTFILTLNNAAIETIEDAKKIENLPSSLAKSAWLLFIPAVIEAARQGDLPEDDDELLSWFAGASAMYAAGTVLFAGNLYRSGATGLDVNALKVENLGKNFAKVTNETIDFAQGNSDATWEDLAIMLAPFAALKGVPLTSQVVKAARSSKEDRGNIIMGPGPKPD